MNAIYAYRPWDPSTYPQNIGDRAPTLLTTWLQHFPQSQPSDRDQEDWIENAVLLHEAKEAGLKLEILPSQGDRIFVSGAGWLTPVARPDAPLGAMFGVWSRSDFVEGLPINMNPVGSCSDAVRIAGDYAKSETFMRYAGRASAFGDGTSDGPNCMEAALRHVVSQGGTGEIFIKTVQKEWATTFRLDPAADTSLWAQLVEIDNLNEEMGGGFGLAWLPVTHEGSTNPILHIQGKITPTYEYRMFVVDGRLVTGAGCIERFTPAENQSLFDTQMEERRNDGITVDCPELRDRYIQFAEQFVAEFAQEYRPGLDYGLDLCVNADNGEICVIELNPPLNLGRYASDVSAWLKAVVARTERLQRDRR